jgi:hypothetical protein
MINLIKKSDRILVIVLASFFCVLITKKAVASPWLETDDVYLRSDLQLLADAGIVTVPVNTFPLPWREISQQIKNSSPVGLEENVRLAFYHVAYKINASKKGYGRRSVKLEASSEDMPNSFGEKNDVSWGAFSNVTFDESKFSMRVSANYALYHDKENAGFNLDNSYFAITTGKTNFFISTQEQWWSPSWLQSITPEERIHPVYELGVERTFIDLPVFGSVYIKSGLNKLRSSDEWEYGWRSRLSLRPLKSFELSASYFDFREPQNGNTEEKYNQLSIDGRLTMSPIVDIPIAFYMQHIVDDSQQDYSDSMFGSDYSFFAANMQVRLIAEYRNSSIESLDKQRYSVGGYIQMENDHQWQLFLHHEINDNDMNQLVGSYRFLVYKGMLSLGLLLSDAQKNSDRINASIAWELHF